MFVNRSITSTHSVPRSVFGISRSNFKEPELNGELKKFKERHAELYTDACRRFDEIAKDRMLTTAAQKLLLRACRTSNEIKALMVYLTEKRRLHIALVIEDIKTKHRRLALDLARGRMMV